MTRHIFPLLSALLLAATLAACAPTREVADEQLGEACTAALRTTLTDEKESIEPDSLSYAFTKSYDDIRLREVTVKATYIYGQSEPYEKTYTCTFTEEWSLFTYMPAFYNLQRDDVKLGNFHGRVVGDTETLLRVNAAIAEHLL